MGERTPMKKRLLAVVITASIISSQAVVAFADPTTQQQVEQSRNQLNSIEQKIAGIEEKIQLLDEEVIAMHGVIDKNNEDIAALNKQIEDTKKEIEKLKEELKQKQDMFDKRMRAMYKTGGQSSYVSVLLESQGFSDFIARAQAIGKLMGLDKQIIEELNEKEKEFNDTKKALDEKNASLLELKKQNEAKMADLQNKKKEQDVLVAAAKEEKAKVVVDLDTKEMELVQFPMDVITNRNSSDDDIKNSITTLVRLRNNIVSTNVDRKIDEVIKKGQETIRQREAQRLAEARAAEEAARNNRPSNGGGGSSKPAPAPKPSPAPSRGPSQGSASAASLINYSYQFLNIPYVWGGTTPSGFDCSGFTSYVFRHFGYNIGRTTYNQIDAGVAVSQSELQPGDLVFTNPGHVGIYIGNGQMIHAPQTGDVLKVSKVWKFYAARRVLR